MLFFFLHCHKIKVQRGSRFVDPVANKCGCTPKYIVTMLMDACDNSESDYLVAVMWKI